jgi:hypothetical protein
LSLPTGTLPYVPVEKLHGATFNTVVSKPSSSTVSVDVSIGMTFNDCLVDIWVEQKNLCNGRNQKLTSQPSLIISILSPDTETLSFPPQYMPDRACYNSILRTIIAT